jgi:hypothetical protein
LTTTTHAAANSRQIGQFARLFAAQKNVTSELIVSPIRFDSSPPLPLCKNELTSVCVSVDLLSAAALRQSIREPLKRRLQSLDVGFDFERRRVGRVNVNQPIFALSTISLLYGDFTLAAGIFTPLGQIVNSARLAMSND